MDANPWRSFSRIVASYHYLRQPDVREQFLAACHTPEGSPHLPWDLLIVDECHNLMPSPFGEDSELCQTLRLVAPKFEHRLFLSATPHNGHTRSFTGLLEMLDPVRFTRTSEMGTAMRGRVEEIVVRRLKREINAESFSENGVAAPRFCTRHPPKAISLVIDPREAELSAAFDAFRTAVRNVVSNGTKKRRHAGTFAVEVLGKRLLSCPTAFAESWRRTRQGFADQAVSEAELTAAERALRQETGDDRETQQREATAATVVGAWLKNFANQLEGEIRRIEETLDALGFDLDGEPITEQSPVEDARFDALKKLIQRLLRINDCFSVERLIIFTEYKTTLDYLARRLREIYPSERILTLFGSGSAEGMNELDRENVKAAFNDVDAEVRVLVATDAASEGLNLHRTARYLLHYDCPWNPSRLEQRNGRLDRYGQARDVTVHHFVSDADPDLRFLDHLIRKAGEIREDLGSLNEVFDRAVHRRLIQGENTLSVQTDLDAGLDSTHDQLLIDADSTIAPEGDARREAELLDAMAKEIDLDHTALGETLETAMSISGGRPQLQVGEERGIYRIVNPDLNGWHDVIDQAVRSPTQDRTKGTLRQLAFDPKPFTEKLGHLSVFLPRQDALLMHLAHPMLQRALGMLARHRYPGKHQVSRWTVRRGHVPTGADALILLSIEELAVNDLRETFHRWVRTLAFPIFNGELGEQLAHLPAYSYREMHNPAGVEDQERASEILEDVNRELQERLRHFKRDLADSLGRQLQADLQTAREREDERYRQRQGEVSSLIERSTQARLIREIEQLMVKQRQGQLFDEDETLKELEQSIEQRQDEIKRRRQHYEDIREQLQHERERILDGLLPARFAMAGDAQVFPVAVEVRIPEDRR